MIAPQPSPPSVPPALRPELEALGDALARLMLEAWERKTVKGGKR